MPNSERVLNRKVQVLIKIAPPPYFILPPNSENFIDLLERVSKILMSYKKGCSLPFSTPSGSEMGK